MKKFITAVAVIVAVIGSVKADSTTPTMDATTDTVGVLTVTSSNLTDVAPVPSGVVPLIRRFKVSSGTLTFLGSGSGSTTNVTVGGGAATNTFITGAAVTFAPGDGWVEIAKLPTRNGLAQNGFVLGTYGGTAVSGLVTGTVNTATVFYWITGRVAGPSTSGGIGH